ncbi:MAG: aa3-type cytochrome c oxidase subunit IV [Sphingomonas oligoaromativorans]
MQPGFRQVEISALQSSEAPMAESSHVEMNAHQQTYGSFVRLLKYGAAACFVAAFVVILLIAN